MAAWTLFLVGNLDRRLSGDHLAVDEVEELTRASLGRGYGLSIGGRSRAAATVGPHFWLWNRRRSASCLSGSCAPGVDMQLFELHAKFLRVALVLKASKSEHNTHNVRFRRI